MRAVWFRGYRLFQPLENFCDTEMVASVRRSWGQVLSLSPWVYGVETVGSRFGDPAERSDGFSVQFCVARGGRWSLVGPRRQSAPTGSRWVLGVGPDSLLETAWVCQTCLKGAGEWFSGLPSPMRPLMFVS